MITFIFKGLIKIFLKNSSVFELIINYFKFLENQNEHIEFIKHFWKLIKEDLNKLKSITNHEEINNTLLIANQDGSKILKNLIYLKKEISAESSELFSLYNEMFEELMNKISSNLQTILFSRAIFLVIAIIE